jgi:hypothetical protein
MTITSHKTFFGWIGGQRVFKPPINPPFTEVVDRRPALQPLRADASLALVTFIVLRIYRPGMLTAHDCTDRGARVSGWAGATACRRTRQDADSIVMVLTSTSRRIRASEATPPEAAAVETLGAR